MTFLAALRCDRVEAPCVFDGLINAERFRLYVETMLVPTLRAGDIVIMDNLGSHPPGDPRRRRPAVVLPKYSPDLNLIEQVFAKLKHWLRKAAARSFDAVCSAIGDILARLTAQKCANYFVNAGYGRT
jgi:transposase